MSNFEGIIGLQISNAMHLSAWTDRWVELPVDEDNFYALLQEKIKKSVDKTGIKNSTLTVKGTY